MTSLPETTDEALLPDLGEGPVTDDSEVLMPGRRIENVPVRISAVLGKLKMDVAQLRELQDGAIIDLDRKVGEPIDLYVNDRLIARGELVLVDGELGVTMTEIVREEDL